MQHGPLDVILLAGRLTLLDRSAEEKLTQKSREAETSLVLGGVFNSGILATGAVEGATYDYAPASSEILAQVSGLQTTSEGLGLPLATSALLFAKHYDLTASVLIGTAKASTLQRNLSSLKTSLPEAFATAFNL